MTALRKKPNRKPNYECEKCEKPVYKAPREKKKFCSRACFQDTTYFSIKERFEFYTFPEPMSGCWIWMGAIEKKKGYGRFWYEDDQIAAYRASFLIYKGEIPDGLVVDHKCRNRICVNPDHLRITTSGENVLCGEGVTAKNALKTQCKRGHQFDQKHIYGAGRICRICRSLRDAARRKRTSNKFVCA